MTDTVQQLTAKILELWWPDTPEADAYNAEVTLADLEHYAALAAGYILQREAALLKVAEAAKIYWPMAVAAIEELRPGYLGAEYYAALKTLLDALDANQKGPTP